jgi:hypothetical protein
VQKEPAQEPDPIQGHDLLAIAVGTIAVSEGDGVVENAEDASIANGYAVRVAGQVFEDQSRRAKGRFASLTVAGKSGDGEWLEKGALTCDWEDWSPC